MSLGLAMIVRNCADTLPAAIEPLLPHVAEVAIVLGGRSNDDTPALAQRYATRLAEYRGPLTDDGSLLDFAAARQQSFDLLTTPWVIVADSDDGWGGLEYLTETVARAQQATSPAILVKYQVSKNQFHQPRIFERLAGRWQGAVHEEFRLHRSESLVWKTSDVWITTQPTPHRRPERRRQNVEIAQAILKKDPTNRRAWAHLTNDYFLLEKFEQVIAAADRYLELWRVNDGEFHDELYFAVYNKCRALIHLNRITSAVPEVLRLLGIEGRASAWAMLADLAYQLAGQGAGAALLELAVFASDKALGAGIARSSYPDNPQWSAGLPCHIKAMALREMGREAEALAALDLGVRLDPTDDWMQQDRSALCLKLNKTP